MQLLSNPSALPLVCLLWHLPALQKFCSLGWWIDWHPLPVVRFKYLGHVLMLVVVPVQWFSHSSCSNEGFLALCKVQRPCGCRLLFSQVCKGDWVDHSSTLSCPVIWPQMGSIIIFRIVVCISTKLSLYLHDGVLVIVFVDISFQYSFVLLKLDLWWVPKYRLR